MIAIGWVWLLKKFIIDKNCCSLYDLNEHSNNKEIMARRKKEENTADVKTRILDSAQELFSEKGFDGVGIEEISQHAKVTKSLIYYYFKGKTDILNGIFARFESESLDLKRELTEKFFSGGPDIRTLIRDFSFPLVAKWKGVIKIALLTELSNISKGPLFAYFDRNLEVARELYAKAGMKLPEDKLFKANLFFMSTLPTIGFAVFADEWCKHYGMRKEELEGIFAEFYTRAMDDLVKKLSGR